MRIWNFIFMAVAMFATGCGSRGDAVTRVKAGDSIAEISIRGFSHSAPVAVTISDPKSLEYMTEGLRTADGGGGGFSYQARLRLASGYQEDIPAIVEEGGGGISFGFGGGILKDETFYKVSVGTSAPICLITNLVLLGKPYK